MTLYSRHESEPIIPDISGSTSFTGEIIHSIYYQNNDLYRGKVVFVLGGSLSGLDIMLETSKVASKVVLKLHIDHSVLRVVLML